MVLESNVTNNCLVISFNSPETSNSISADDWKELKEKKRTQRYSTLVLLEIFIKKKLNHLIMEIFLLLIELQGNVIPQNISIHLKLQKKSTYL